MPPRTSNKVKVIVRARPTSNFATEMISIGRDNRVRFLILINKAKLSYQIFYRQLVFIEHHQQLLLIIKSMIGHFILMVYLIMLIKKLYSIQLLKILSIGH